VSAFELVLASRNRKKRLELQALLGVLDVNVRSAEEFPNVADVEEDGRTFLENARKKAHAFARATGLPALADDSGLEVDALGGAPGVRSHRYAGPNATDSQNNEKLLRELQGVPPPKRTARFRCAAVLAWPDGRVIEAEGACEGILLDAPRGAGGFGYDPLFFVPEHGKTFAELPAESKNAISHRARALERLRALLVKRLRG
jgi:XTP/dITP diphosphohydrolase